MISKIEMSGGILRFSSPLKKEISKAQIELMIHALGLHREKKSYRNRFYVYEPDPEWEDLVSKGFAVKRDMRGHKVWNGVYYHCTDDGINLINTARGIE